MINCKFVLLTVCVFGSSIVDFPLDLTSLEETALEGDANAQYVFAALQASVMHSVEYQTLLFFSASTGGHALALLAQGWRHSRGVGVPQSCQTAALYYLEIARSVAGVYSQTVPQAVELVRLSLHDLTGSVSQKQEVRISLEEMSLLKTMAQTDAHIAYQIAKRHLLGTEGVEQSYEKAKDLLTLHSDDPRSLSLLGYMFVMGLGVLQDPTHARELFNQALALGSGEESMAWNGLGYLEYTENKYEEAFNNFNSSAFAGSSDGLFNLASLYLSGQGVAQNFQRAYIYYSQAAEMGHTPATYALGVLLLNGIGVGRDCKTGVRLLKDVGERTPVAAELLALARKISTRSPEKALVYYTLLAEAGLEVAQSNAAFLLEKGTVFDWKWDHDMAAFSTQASLQRYLELSADQGGITSELKLGDLAYYGRGVETVMSANETASQPTIVERQTPDFALALASYRKCLDAKDETLAAVAAFNVGFMYHFGEGVSRDFRRASEFYERSFAKKHPLLVSVVQNGLSIHEYFSQSFSWTVLKEDWRFLSLTSALIILPSLLVLRQRL